ncbi:MAG: AAA family ATPase, partial [Bacteroidales bacterium]|nr:AAA family ATPase [Bacteroidales bacterium]
MLQHLKIENYALIRQMDIPFQKGFIAITGETGAGKSIMLGALGLVLGQRADSNVLWDKEKKCIVEAVFELDNDFTEAFESNDLDFSNQTIFRREIGVNGKSRAFINDTPVQLTVMKELGEKLMDIHSQHNT